MSYVDGTDPSTKAPARKLLVGTRYTILAVPRTPALDQPPPTARNAWLVTADGRIAPVADPRFMRIAEPPPAHLRPILAQLMTGSTDHTASQRLNLSPRTFSRRVSDLLDYLEVASRFQAGVEAAYRGWVSTRHRP